MTTIVYLHGFRSSPASVKAAMVRDAVTALPETDRPLLYIPELDDGPRAAVEGVAAWIDANARAPLTLVGSSLGGYYAAHLAARYAARAVLVNPAVRPYDDLAPYVGAQTNLYTGRVFEVKASHFDELRALDAGAHADRSRFLVYLQSGDEVLDWRLALARHAGAWFCVEAGGDHAFQHFDRHVPTILRFVRDGFAR